MPGRASIAPSARWRPVANLWRISGPMWRNLDSRHCFQCQRRHAAVSADAHSPRSRPCGSWYGRPERFWVSGTLHPLQRAAESGYCSSILDLPVVCSLGPEGTGLHADDEYITSTFLPRAPNWWPWPRPAGGARFDLSSESNFGMKIALAVHMRCAATRRGFSR